MQCDSYHLRSILIVAKEYLLSIHTMGCMSISLTVRKMRTVKRVKRGKKLTVNERSLILYTYSLTKGLMNKTTLLKELNRELKKLNTVIDTKIVRGCSYEKEARRHRDLLSALQRLGVQEDTTLQIFRRSRFGKSPVRKSLNQRVSTRLFNWNFA